MLDTHAHLHYPTLLNRLPQVMKNFTENGGKYVLSSGTDMETNHAELELARDYPEILTSIGLHPELLVPGCDIYISAANKSWIGKNVAELQKLIEQNIKNIVAIGECGLDYYWVKRERLSGRDKIYELQRELLAAQIKLAQQFHLPMVIHCRDEDGDKHCEADILDLLVNVGGSQIRGVFHSYTGSLSYLDDILNLGFCVSFNGIVTYKNADNVREILAAVPDDRLLIETDAPFLVPHLLRRQGAKVCEPAMVGEIAEFVAKLRGLTVDALWRIVEENFESLFLRDLDYS